MLSLRQEITNYSRSCERLISSASSPDHTAFSQDEVQLIAYYAGEMTNLVNNLRGDRKDLIDRKRKPIQEYARACEALLLLSDLSADERQDIRRSVADLTARILELSQDPTSR